MSVHKIRHGFRRWRHISKKQRRRLFNTRVWLNGRELRDCFYADARRGVVRFFVRGADGQIAHLRGEAARQELRGRVRVRVKR